MVRWSCREVNAVAICKRVDVDVVEAMATPMIAMVSAPHGEQPR